MDVATDEIAAGVYRLSVYVPEVAAPAGFTFNHFLIDAEQPMLFHTGSRAMFPALVEAAARVVPLEKLAWIGFGHVESDECGAMNQWLAAAPNAKVVHGRLGCDISLNDLADRPPMALDEGEVLDLGGKRMRWLSTPHVPHGWEAGAFYEEADGVLFCGDILTHAGRGPALTREDVTGPAAQAERMFRAMTLAPNTGRELERMAELEPRTLALMHGSSFEGDGAAALRELAAFCRREAEARA
ncbi:MAG: MBL fold metallo-hydrolase [Phenylobacterium sp.]|jgi:flavorubredoxin|uniref:MBL fold metallo-hydrolase n=1 Tax=Phenylobacterium sp. TaxID=1871053 RepID=UPI002A35FEB7|nr:MBL fold metallo-hydrolase [Phenylobacterium sp.]MDX9996790.1 MBL fold metallo-hydrolase [Phenylobacterium sp.]